MQIAVVKLLMDDSIAQVWFRVSTELYALCLTASRRIEGDRKDFSPYYKPKS
ncbi:MAG: hypothetical protein GDA56_28320 [Hormoscilla sp. GM7CHS1pb]|nr:hypothetical protein [Hormoscilla sp. GM7CHS1pb]